MKKLNVSELSVSETKYREEKGRCTKQDGTVNEKYMETIDLVHWMMNIDLRENLIRGGEIIVPQKLENATLLEYCKKFCSLDDGHGCVAFDMCTLN